MCVQALIGVCVCAGIDWCVCVQALIGGSIEVPTLDGRVIRVPITEIVRYE